LGERRLVGDFCNTIGPGADIQRVRADLSPLSSEQALIGLLKQVDGAISHGAKVIMGGKRIDPTILTDIKPNNPAFREEFFGPVALFFRVKGRRPCDRARQRLRLRIGRLWKSIGK
jgi:acyl-CoA reductase-like NAD-dependent aldehyde dehydrogenase